MDSRNNNIVLNYTYVNQVENILLEEYWIPLN